MNRILMTVLTCYVLFFCINCSIITESMNPAYTMIDTVNTITELLPENNDSDSSVVYDRYQCEYYYSSAYCNDTLDNVDGLIIPAE